ncbi:hypothetical protein AB3N62_02020 [Leptospira sp. WS4.C2]
MTNIRKINLDKQALVVPIEGLGCMGMSILAEMNIYGVADS